MHPSCVRPEPATTGTGLDGRSDTTNVTLCVCVLLRSTNRGRWCGSGNKRHRGRVAAAFGEERRRSLRIHLLRAASGGERSCWLRRARFATGPLTAGEGRQAGPGGRTAGPGGLGGPGRAQHSRLRPSPA